MRSSLFFVKETGVGGHRHTIERYSSPSSGNRAPATMARWPSPSLHEPHATPTTLAAPSEHLLSLRASSLLLSYPLKRTPTPRSSGASNIIAPATAKET